MYFKQFYLGCLAHASYLIGSDGEAAVVDPQRDVEQYLAEAAREGLKIKYVIETHLHADFVSGHRELAERTGAEIVFSQHAGAAFPHRAVREGDELNVGQVTLRFIETPGHTPESICALIIDREVSAAPQKVLTGDTLFVGDVGRPDLAGGKGYTPLMMAGMMYDSLHGKLLQLDDGVEVYPAHGAGSLCGRNMSQETHSTIGQQRRFNYALQPMSRDEFIHLMTSELPPAPAYFSRDAEINRTGAAALEELPRPSPLAPAAVRELAAQGCVILDVRSAADFGAGHLPGAVNIGLGGQFAIWAGSLLSPTAPLLIVAETESQVDESVMRLARVGLENVKGYLRDGMLAWRQAGFETKAIPQLSVAELRALMDKPEELQVVDVRRPAEYAGGHVPRAVSAPLAPQLAANIARSNLNLTCPTAVICAGGYRSSAAASLLAQHGFAELYNVTGGTGAWINSGYPVE